MLVSLCLASQFLVHSILYSTMSSSSPSPPLMAGLTWYLDARCATLDFTELPVGTSYKINLRLPRRGMFFLFHQLELKPNEDEKSADLLIQNITQEEIDTVRSCSFRLGPHTVNGFQIEDCTIPGIALRYLEDGPMTVSELTVRVERAVRFFDENGFETTPIVHDTRQLMKYPGLALVSAMRRGLVVPVRSQPPQKKTEEEKVGEALEKLAISAAEKDVQ